MDPLQWLREKYAEITRLPARLEGIAARAHAVLSNRSLPYATRQRAGRIWASANADRLEVLALLGRIREQPTAGLGAVALPVLVVVGVSAAAVATTLVAIFGRATTYEQELAAIASGHVTPAELDELREGAPVAGGVAGSLREARNLLALALVGAGALWAVRRYAR